MLSVIVFIGLVALIIYSMSSKATNAGKGGSSGGGSSSTNTTTPTKKTDTPE